MSTITVVKIGGSTLGQHDTSLDDIAALHASGERFVVVHGGGALINEWLDRHGIESRFVRGLRVTDERALEVVVAVLAGLVNKRLVAELQARGAPAVGFSGADGGLLLAERRDPELGYVGDITSVDGAALRAVVEGGAVAVLAPIAIERSGEALSAQLLNINADTAAGYVAAALPARRLVFLTDVAGVLDSEGRLREELKAADAEALVRDGVVSGGMLPKVQAALVAAKMGVYTLIGDGREQGALRALLEQKGAATRIR